MLVIGVDRKIHFSSYEKSLSAGTYLGNGKDGWERDFVGGPINAASRVSC
jgi:hypothetical protein